MRGLSELLEEGGDVQARKRRHHVSPRVPAELLGGPEEAYCLRERPDRGAFFGVTDDAPEAARKPDFPEKRQKNSPFGS